jgi:hypothetical protein
MTTTPTHFQQLLHTAMAQSQPQRLLFVFAGAELPDGASAAQRERFAAGRGGALVPLACVDKDPAELTGFGALLAESRNACPPWQAVFIGALSGRDGRAPTSQQVDAALNTMVDNVRQGRFAAYMALDPDGNQLTFS